MALQQHTDVLDRYRFGVAEDDSYTVVGETARGIAHGVVGAAIDTYNFVDTVGEALTGSEFLMDGNANWLDQYIDRPKTIYGGLVEGVTQFGVGLVGLNKFAGVTRLNKVFGATRAGKYLDAARKARKAKKAGFWSKESAAIIAAAETKFAAVDMVAFDGMEGRLADLLDGTMVGRLPLMDWLETDEDDTQLVGRFKNAVEGSLVAGPAFTAAFKVLGFVNSKVFRKTAKAARDVANGRRPDYSLDDALEFEVEAEEFFESTMGWDTNEAQAAAAVMDSLGLRDEEGALVEGFAGVFRYDDISELLDPDVQTRFDEGARGVMMYTEAGRRFVVLAGSSDVSTATHEFAHIFRDIVLNSYESARAAGFDPGQLDDLAMDMGALKRSNGEWQWTIEAEEKFAEAFERWIMDEDFEIPAGSEGAMLKLGAMVRRVYERVPLESQPGGGVAVSEPMQKFLKNLFDKTEGVEPPPTKVEREVEQRMLFQEAVDEKEAEKKLTERQAAAVFDANFNNVDRATTGDYGIPIGLNEGNFDGAVRGLDTLSENHPDVLAGEAEWDEAVSSLSSYQTKALKAPLALIKELNDGSAAKRLRAAESSIVEKVNDGLDRTKKVGDAVRKDTTGRSLAQVLMWSAASLRASPFNQEAAFLDSIDIWTKHLDDARAGKFNEGDFDFDIKETIYKGSGRPSASNQMQIRGTRHLLNKINSKAQVGEDVLAELHEAWFREGRSSREAMRDVWRIIGLTENVKTEEGKTKTEGKIGMDNKLLRFARLATGYHDVIIIDAIQQQTWWGANSAQKDALNALFADDPEVERLIRLADTQGQIDAAGTKGGQGLAIYEAIEQALEKRLEELYAGTGREGSISRFHWEMWVLNGDEPSEIAHETLDWFWNPEYRDGIREGRFNQRDYGLVYRKGDLPKYFMPTRYGILSFPAEEWAGIREKLTKKGVLRSAKSQTRRKANGDFKDWTPEDRVDFSRPWTEDPNVNPQAYALLLAKHAEGFNVVQKDGTVKLHRWTAKQRAALDLAYEHAAAHNGLGYERFVRSAEDRGRRLKQLAGAQGRGVGEWLDVEAPSTVKWLRDEVVQVAEAGKDTGLGAVLRVAELRGSDAVAKKYGLPAGEGVRHFVDMTGGAKMERHAKKGVITVEGNRITHISGGDEARLAWMIYDLRVNHGVEYVATKEAGLEMVTAAGFTPAFKDTKGKVYSFANDAQSDLLFGLDDVSLPKVKQADVDTRIAQVLVDRRRAEVQSKMLVDPGERYQSPLFQPPLRAPEGSDAQWVEARTPEVEAAARQLASGEIDSLDYDRIQRTARPVLPYQNVPQPASDADAIRALGGKGVKYGAARALPEGTDIALRLDIPAYTRHNTWVVTAHEPGKGKRKAGKVIGYDSVGAITDATFWTERAAETFKIAQGESDKFPMATVVGKKKGVTPAEAKAIAEKALSDPAWTQVGFDPRRHGYFYDRADTGRVVESASEVVQIGPLVLAKDAKFGKRENFLFQEGIDERFMNRRRAPRTPEDYLNLDRMHAKREVAIAMSDLLEHTIAEAGQRASRSLEVARKEAGQLYERMAREAGHEPRESVLSAIRSSDLAYGIKEKSAQLHILRDYLARIHAEYKSRWQGLDPRDMTDAELLEMRKQWDIVVAFSQEVSKAKSEFGRALGDLRIRPDGELLKHRFVSDAVGGQGGLKDGDLPASAERTPDQVSAETREYEAFVDGDARRDGNKRRAPESPDRVNQETGEVAPVSPSVDTIDKLPGGRSRTEKEMSIVQELLDHHDLTGQMDRELPVFRLSALWAEYLINSLLSGLKTHIINGAGNLFMVAFRPLEAAAGNLLTLRFREAAGDLAELLSTAQFIGPAAGRAKRAFQSDTPLLTSTQRLDTIDQVAGVRQFSSKAMGLEQGTAAAKVVDVAGTIVNLPSRGLVGMDEFFKSLAYLRRMKRHAYEAALRDNPGDARAAVAQAEQIVRAALEEDRALSTEIMRKRAVDEGRAAGLRGSMLERYANRYMDNNWGSQVMRDTEDAVREARAATWTTELDPGRPGVVRSSIAGLGSFVRSRVQTHPILSPIAPFVTTPVNILNWTLDRSFGIPSDTWRMLRDRMKGEAADPAARAELVGRVATASTLFTAAIALAYDYDEETGLPRITGNRPKDVGLRELWERAGVQPNSILIDGKYISYARFEPFSTHFSVIADIAQKAREIEADHGEATAADVMGATFAALTSTMVNKSYLQGLSTFIGVMSDDNIAGDTGNPALRFTESLSQAMVPYSSLIRQTGNPTFDLGTEYFTEIRSSGFLESAASGFVRALPDGEQKFEPRRNLYGEPVKKAAYYGPESLSPIAVREINNTPVEQAMFAAGHYPRTPEWKNYRGINMVEHWKNGQSAFDRFIELHGEIRIEGRRLPGLDRSLRRKRLTLREAHEALVQSPEFLKYPESGTPDADTPRKEMFELITNRYRDAAFEQVVEEYPTVAQRVLEIDAEKNLMRRADQILR